MWFMDLDVQGAAQLRASTDPEIQRALVDVFILPSNLAELELRIRGQGEMPEEELARRLRNAEDEMSHWPGYSLHHRQQRQGNRLRALHCDPLCGAVAHITVDGLSGEHGYDSTGRYGIDRGLQGG